MSQDGQKAHQGSSKYVDAGPGKVLVRVTAAYPNESANQTDLDSSPFCQAITGEIEALGSEVQGREVGDVVLALHNGLVIGADMVSMSAQQVFPNITFDAAGESLAPMHAVWTAEAILTQELSLPTLTSPPNRKPGDKFFERRVLIAGGETALGAALVKLLHTTAPDIKVIATSMMNDQERLLERTIALVKLGAVYAIDVAAEDLMEHLRVAMERYEGVDVIVDVGGNVKEREELQELVVEGGQIVHCKDVHVEETMLRMLQDEGVASKMVEAAKHIGETLTADHGIT